MGEKIPRCELRSHPALLVLAALLVLVSGPGRVGESAVAEPPPTPDETLLLELLNRARADPAAEAERIVAGKDRLSWGDRIDWEKFRAELQAVPPAPPLVFGPLVLRAARNHARYLDANAAKETGVSGHVEKPGLPGFTGAGLSDRFRAVGLPPYGAENISYESDPWAAHASLVVDFSNREADGMQPGRGHRANDFEPELSRFGAALGTVKTHTPITWNFAYRDARRLGGVVFRDENGNRFYDPGEGIGGATVTVGESETRTVPSGAWWMEIPEAAIEVRIRVDDLDFSSRVSAGRSNAKRDAILLSEAESEDLEARIADLSGRELDPKASHRDRVDLLDLAERARTAPLDDARRRRIADLTREATKRLESDRRAARNAIANGSGLEENQRVRELASTYEGTAAEAWFRDAENVARLARRHAGPLLHPDQLDAARAERVAAYFEKAAADAATTEWGDWLRRAAVRIRGGKE